MRWDGIGWDGVPGVLVAVVARAKRRLGEFEVFCATWTLRRELDSAGCARSCFVAPSSLSNPSKQATSRSIPGYSISERATNSPIDQRRSEERSVDRSLTLTTPVEHVVLVYTATRPLNPDFPGKCFWVSMVCRYSGVGGKINNQPPRRANLTQRCVVSPDALALRFATNYPTRIVMVMILRRNTVH